MSKATKNAQRHRIKAATRDLIEMVGGLERASNFCGHATSTLSRWQSADHADLINLVAIIALESECGMLVVTKVMAAIHGRCLTEGGVGQGTSPFMDHFSKMTTTQAAFSGLAADCLADLDITPAEATVLDRVLAKQEVVTMEFRAALAKIMAGEKVPIVGGNVASIGGSQ